jgi:uncharacterized linocin/CFP29 family protein
MAGTAYLRDSEYRYVKKGILEGKVEDLIARKIISPDPNVGPGAQEAQRWDYNVPNDEAEHIPKGGPYPYMTTSISPTSVPIHKFGLGIEFDEWDLASARSMGKFSLDNRLPRDLGRKMAEYEDKYILNGDSTIGVTGLIDKATNTYACASKWDSTNPDPYEDLNQATSEIETDLFKVKYVIMNTADKHLLRRRDTYGNIYLDQIVEALNITKDSILTTKVITKGTALLCDAGPDIAELKIAEEMVILPQEVDGDTVRVRAREKLGMDVYKTDAFCKVTGIS